MVRVANGALRLPTYGRQSSMPMFSPNRRKRRRFVSPTSDELVVISCADLFSFPKHVWGIGFCGMRVGVFDLHGMFLEST